ncbi:MAG: desulfoferrodoxin [Candidatus Pacearchaeota archaeon]|nr:desulfoferrodoxin [Candidatus Pacearchaeota archaeon]
MTKQREIYKCEVCGNIVEVLHEGVGTLVCCNQNMKLMEENTVDATTEKHVPIQEKNEEGVVVTVGEVSHPMTDEHYIEWIEVSTDKGVSKKFLKPGEKPEAKFPVKKDVKIREYCNLHGLWRGK